MKTKLAMVLKNRKTVWLFGAAVLLAIGITSVALLANHHRKADPQAQMKVLVREVGALIELPTNENPTVATVTDQQTVRKQAFFVHAQTGDKVLIYASNQVAYLYRPSQHKLINVGPINGTVSYARFSVTIRNGTPDSAFGETLRSKLTASFPNAKVTSPEPAQRTDYPSTIVIAVNEKADSLAQQVADAMGAQVGILPIGEAKPTSDILVIIGKDYRL